MAIIKLDDVSKQSFPNGATYQTIVGDEDGSTPVRIGVQVSPPGYSTGTHAHPYGGGECSGGHRYCLDGRCRGNGGDRPRHDPGDAAERQARFSRDRVGTAQDLWRACVFGKDRAPLPRVGRLTPRQRGNRRTVKHDPACPYTPSRSLPRLRARMPPRHSGPGAPGGSDPCGPSSTEAPNWRARECRPHREAPVAPCR